MLAGRDEDVRRIVDLLTDPAPAVQLRLIQIDGSIGVGKSSLLATVLSQTGAAASSAAGPARVFLAHGDGLHADGPLTAHRVMIEELLEDRLERLLDTASPGVLAARCAEALGRETSPVIVAVDDAQWLGPASEAFLVSLIQRAVGPSVTVVLVHRSGKEPAGVIAAARRRGAAHEHFTLAPLPDTAIAALAAGLDERQKAAVIAVAQGNPLFARTAAAAFHRHPEADRADDVLRLAEGSRTAVLSAAVADDMAALPESSRRALEALVVLGRPHAPETAAEVAGLSHDEYEAAVRELHGRGLLAPSPHEAVHPVVRYSVYQHVPDERRVAMHRLAASLPGTALFDRADHLAQVGPAMAADEAEVLVEAAQLAIGSDPGAALGWLGRLAPEHHTTTSHVLLARTMILSGRFGEAIEQLRAIATADPESVEARILLANALRMTGDTAEARALLAAAQDSIDARLLREYIDIVALLDGRVPESLVSRLESLPGEVNQVVAAVYRTMDLLSEGRVRQARATFHPVPAWMTAAESDELAGVLHAAACAVWAAYILDQYEVGAGIANRGLQLAQRSGQADVWSNLGTGLAFCQASLGLLDEADESGERAIADAERYGTPDLVAMARAGLMIAAQGRADPALLKERLEQLDAAPVPVFGWWRRAVLTTRTRVSAMLGSPEPCPELLGEPRDAMAALRYADAAAVAAALGDIGTGRTLISTGIAIADEQDSRGQKAMLLTTHAEILLRNGDALGAGNLFRKARDTFQQLGMRLQLGRALVGIARSDALLSERAEPLAVLSEREREVAELIAEGLTNRDVAERLVISRRTVENHVRNMMKKLGVDTRQDIADIAAVRPVGTS